MKKTTVIATVSVAFVALMVAPSESTANAAEPSTSTNMSIAPQAAMPEEPQHTEIGASCKLFGMWCRSTMECCRPYVCRFDRYRGGSKCV